MKRLIKKSCVDRGVFITEPLYNSKYSYSYYINNNGNMEKIKNSDEEIETIDSMNDNMFTKIDKHLLNEI